VKKVAVKKRKTAKKNAAIKKIVQKKLKKNQMILKNLVTRSIKNLTPKKTLWNEENLFSSHSKESFRKYLPVVFGLCFSC
jgi:hypothetical protein